MRILSLCVLFASSSVLAGGQEVYNASCKMCHGEFGGTPVLPNARNLKTSKYKNPKGNTYEGIMDVLEKGLPGTAMLPQAHIPLADRQAVAKWIIEQIKAAGKDKAEAPADEKVAEAEPKAEEAPAETAAAPAAPAAAAAPAATAPKSITIAAAMAYELRNVTSRGLTVYDGARGINPRYNVLGFLSKMPDPVMPGRDETAEQSAEGAEAAPEGAKVK